MTAAPFRIEALSPAHPRSDFDCGSPPLDRYLKEQVGQDVRRRVASCFVAVDVETGAVAGYFTLAAAGVPLTDLPDTLARRLPRYPSVPVARLGRLAVDRRYQGRQLGAALLWDAVQRALQSPVATFAVMVDAKDEAAARFYQRHGFIAFAHAPLQMVLPLAGLKSAN